MRSIALFVGAAACGGGDSSATVDAAPCTDAHDEDGDGIGDRCDICPAAPDPAQRDTTERATMLAFPDGVGDACDPRPQLSGDVLAAFHAFADPGAEVAWNGSGWTITDDAARASGDARWIHRTPEQGDGLLVRARIPELALLTAGSFEIVLDGNGVESGFTCKLAGADQLIASELGGASMATTTAFSGTITLTAWRRIDPQRRGELVCSVLSDGGMANVEMPTSDNLAIGAYGFAQTAATGVVSSVVVYTFPALPGQDL